MPRQGLQVVAVVKVVSVQDQAPVFDQRRSLEQRVGRPALLPLLQVAKGEGAESIAELNANGIGAIADHEYRFVHQALELPEQVLE